MAKEDEAKELLKKYLDNTLDPSGIRQVEEWYASFEAGNTHIDKARKAEIGAVMLSKLNQKIMPEPMRTRTLLSHQVLKVAAAIVIVSGLAISIWSGTRKQVLPKGSVTVCTNKMERKTITLTDGSEITLNPSATITYPIKFSSSSRTVELTEGEAFFKIAHDELRPFTVKTSHDLQTRVLGTSFRIRSYQARPQIDVLVATGKVSVGNSHQVFGNLEKGQQISYDKKNQRAIISYTPAPEPVIMKFEGAPLQNVLEKLEYAYNIRITLKDPSLGKLKCSATFNTSLHPAEILDILCSLHHLKFGESENHKTFNVYRL